MINISINANKLMWKYNNKSVEIEKQHLIEYKYIEKESLVLLLFEDENIYPILEGVNEDGATRFKFESADEFGVNRFAEHPHIEMPVVGWEKENEIYMEYYFSIDPINGKLSRHFRAY